MHVSMTKGEVSFVNPVYSFCRRHVSRFEFLARLAYERKHRPLDKHAWVTLDAIRALPSWRNRTQPTAGTVIGRYIVELEKGGLAVISPRRWRSLRYEIAITSEAISFDIPLEDVQRRLGIAYSASPGSEKDRQELLWFTERYMRAAYHFMRGHLQEQQGVAKAKRREGQNAWQLLVGLENNDTLSLRLRSLALVAAARAADRLGKHGAARSSLEDEILSQVDDPLLTARISYARLWQHYRADPSTVDVACESALVDLLPNTVDAGFAGALADQLGMSRSWAASKLNNVSARQSGIQGALLLLTQGLWYRLLSENSDWIQMSCFNIGNSLQRLGIKHFAEAERWIRLSQDICRKMNVGGYNNIADIILARMALKRGQAKKFMKLLDKAKSEAKAVGNRINLSNCYEIEAQYFAGLKRPKEVIESLLEAKKHYTHPAYHWHAKDEELRARFPEEWSDVRKKWGALTRNDAAKRNLIL